jgi:metallophosphoesterase superfamily enzyme
LTDQVTSDDVEVIAADPMLETVSDLGPDSMSERDLATEAAEGLLPSLLIEESIEIELPIGSRTVVVSDLHLPTVATPTSTAVADEVAAVLGETDGPVAFVIAGDGFEMLDGPPDVDRTLDAHPQFTDAVARFAGQAGHHPVVLSGNHDGQLAWDGHAATVLTDRLGARDIRHGLRPV